MEQSRLNLGEFRHAAFTVKHILRNEQVEIDLSPLNTVAKALEPFAKDETAFLSADAVTRAYIRGGAIYLGKKFTDDKRLFCLVREMLGNVRNIQTIDEKRKVRTGKFLAGIGCLDW